MATHNFYFDPTHQRPLPPVLLDFTTEYAGFERSRILRLQENQALSRSDAPGFWDVLSGASPDYSVIAQKAGPAPLMKS
ncbi:MAG: methyltransferase type 11, partial [Gammaproteobacteria bacterium]|nr:methyltransferase type 11 [Gammaproteobacteria bacterium]